MTHPQDKGNEGLIREMQDCIDRERLYYSQIALPGREVLPENWLLLLERALTALKAQGWQPISKQPEDEQVLGRSPSGKFKIGEVFDSKPTGLVVIDASGRWLKCEHIIRLRCLPQPPQEKDSTNEAD